MPYRTKTNHELNAYRSRLNQKLFELEDRKERWYKVGEGWILTESKNKLRNPNGGWKWNGWEIVCREYSVRVFAGDTITVENGKPTVHGWTKKSAFFEGGDEAREAANEYFKGVKEYARTCKYYND